MAYYGTEAIFSGFGSGVAVFAGNGAAGLTQAIVIENGVAIAGGGIILGSSLRSGEEIILSNGSKGKGSDSKKSKSKKGGAETETGIYEKVNDNYLKQRKISAHRLKNDILGGKGVGIPTGEYIK